MNAAVPEPFLSALVRLSFKRVLEPGMGLSIMALCRNVVNSRFLSIYDTSRRQRIFETGSRPYDLERSEFEETISLRRMKSLYIALAGSQVWFGSEGV